MKVFEPGTCRYCGCKDAERCRLMTGEDCGWWNASRNVCTNPSCVRQFEKDLAAMPKRKKLTPADVHQLIRRRGRKPHRAAGKDVA